MTNLLQQSTLFLLWGIHRCWVIKLQKGTLLSSNSIKNLRSERLRVSKQKPYCERRKNGWHTLTVTINRKWYTRLVGYCGKKGRRSARGAAIGLDSWFLKTNTFQFFTQEFFHLFLTIFIYRKNLRWISKF